MIQKGEIFLNKNKGRLVLHTVKSDRTGNQQEVSLWKRLVRHPIKT